ncbi:hypothetical protein, conserved [Trypanosoma brucei gambiense DAL972]|uniref:Uncharacterized protein n=2 Tax=Trypanosoma brucei TaxID=5691 RepID=C9ZP00_TRYB9|nr:hypothetical protein, conserved [Trypanosoma brucei gambiense DAL972]RHW72309.1 hypothetical protein DPX39_050025500 [Trypanosoma brucei equiperdum]CBH11128.1 hypothetical protein, conserved [Trypanosoma brucei gambiense DAL972]|eukprot:XP_011773415.1 hypothetical protein, conserved [Trypanosoma brucei gambiense DAL972]
MEGVQPLNVRIVREAGDRRKVKLFLHNTSGTEREGYPVMFSIRCCEPDFYIPVGIETTDGILLSGECRGVLLQLRDPKERAQSWGMEREGKFVKCGVINEQQMRVSCGTNVRASVEAASRFGNGSLDALHSFRDSDSSFLTTGNRYDFGVESSGGVVRGSPLQRSSVKSWNAVVPSVLPSDGGSAKHLRLSASEESHTPGSLEDELVHSSVRSSRSPLCTDSSRCSSSLFVHYTRLGGEKRSIAAAKEWLEAQQGKYNRWLEKVHRLQGKDTAGVNSPPTTVASAPAPTAPHFSALCEPVRWVKRPQKAPANLKLSAFWRKPFSKGSAKLFKVGKESNLCIRVSCELDDPNRSATDIKHSGGPLSDGLLRLNTAPSHIGFLRREQPPVTGEVQRYEHSEDVRSSNGNRRKIPEDTTDRSPTALFRLERHENQVATGRIPFGKLDPPARGDVDVGCSASTRSDFAATLNGKQSLHAEPHVVHKEVTNCPTPNGSASPLDDRADKPSMSEKLHLMRWDKTMSILRNLSAPQMGSAICEFVKRCSPHLESLGTVTLNTVVRGLHSVGNTIEGSINTLHVVVLSVLFVATICLLFAIIRGDSYSNELDIAMSEIG